MMRFLVHILMLATAMPCLGYFPPQPFAGAVGNTNTTAMHLSTNAFVAWADGYVDMVYGDGVGATWKTPEKALGMANGDSFGVVSLGRGGRITLTFPNGISDGGGFDFAVFENAVTDTFLELAWVEVSSDGTNFVRFPNFSLTPSSVGPYGSVNPTFIHGYGGKYRQGYGTPFDLSELHLVRDSILAGTDRFSTAYENGFMNAFDSLDFSNVQYVRLVDVVGDGFDMDSEGFAIYDPYETFDSVGFDLDAVGVINEAAGPPVMPGLELVAVDDYITLEYAFDWTVWTNGRVEQSFDLSDWSNAVPDVVEQGTNGTVIQRTVRFPVGVSNRFYRLLLDEL